MSIYVSISDFESFRCPHCGTVYELEVDEETNTTLIIDCYKCKKSITLEIWTELRCRVIN